MAMNRKRLTGLSVVLGLLAIAPTAANAATEQVPKCYGVTGFDDTFRVMRIKTDFGDSFGGNMRAVFVKWQNSDGQFLGSGAQTTSIASPGMIELAFTATSVDFVGGFGRIWGVIMVLGPRHEQRNYQLSPTPRQFRRRLRSRCFDSMRCSCLRATSRIGVCDSCVGGSIFEWGIAPRRSGQREESLNVTQRRRRT
jgi:hypothetical protein